ncbi:MAG: 6-carboxytetrahydropterin synthase [Melioribacteraceae bacterium]|nr:6-carboxytetrahydropterin synthase [Melioribacteraceae bacterium]MCF8354577.1 6-carboxytetrahydropterin synthase [Melioribacteraceae bacterium]MCF8394929.1 6-carboxytetrahydropterin synthase [Melioribacteraceae bacterium]MCF8420154.1 6-carboxytetrahydropterin synthase [Melioribacteraceae bacterium]
MPKLFVTRREVFSASHRLYNPDLSDEENDRIYDKCNNPHGHGHNYTLEVTVRGDVNEQTGYVIDLKELKRIMREHVIKMVDHKYLNYDVDFMKGIIPTAENIAAAIWNQLYDKIPGGELYSVKIYETENNYAEFRGE